MKQAKPLFHISESLESHPDFNPLPEGFYNKSTLVLAQDLLGCLLVKETAEGRASGFIVETEAYIGPDDRAAHSFGNRRTKRTEAMFAHPGTVYTYLMHTHTLVNVVSAPREKPEAILIRAIEPYSGIELMKKRRGLDDLKKLASGPGKLTKAMGITMNDYGNSFTQPPLYISKGISPAQISSGPRIGIGNSGEAKDYPWRFWISTSPFISK
ncbi:DNA-3-methyladenine glycosylase [Peribacillus sp. SCS-155]|uniref:DNA-3-methyladenine glycosylase n=1 Tax=Peribacillus sedimenti TaxID=3115297 RepID=UPI003905906C